MQQQRLREQLSIWSSSEKCTGLSREIHATVETVSHKKTFETSDIVNKLRRLFIFHHLYISKMNNSMENSEDPFADIWISNWERQCEIELENEPDLDQAVLSERDLSTQKLWYLFQNSATSVAQLFKGRIMFSRCPLFATKP